MAKYVIDGSTLTDIADAIRTQYAEDSPIAVSDMAEAILGIEGGGGSGDDLPFLIEYGEFEVMSDMLIIDKTTSYNPYILEHNLGKVPDIFFLWTDNPHTTSQNSVLNAQQLKIDNFSRSIAGYYVFEGVVRRTNGDTGAYASTSASGNLVNTEPTDSTSMPLVVTSEKAYIGKQAVTNYQYYLRSGNVYKWLAIAKL